MLKQGHDPVSPKMSHAYFIMRLFALGGKKTLAVRKITQINCEVLEVRSLLPSMGCIVSCNMTWTIAARGWAPVYEKVDNKYHGTKPIH